MANLPAQTTKLTSKSQEASLRACISSDDRISSLPDALIHRILSLLSTKQAVATSVLSKRWVSLWTFAHTLDLEDSHRCRFNEQDKMKFVHFVYRVLLLNGAGSVEKFRFRFNCDPVCDYLCVNTWICSAILRGFQEVDISVPEVLKKDLMKLPSGLFLMKALKILKLNGGVMVDVPSSVCLPNLKILHLLRVEYANVESIRCFISGCLSLEELHIDARISPENMVNFSISSPTLNSLYLASPYKFHPHPQVEINAPALKYLNISSSGLWKPDPNFIENFPCLIEANISYLNFPRLQILRALYAAKYLELDGDLAFLAHHDAFPLFVNLTRLELHGFLSWRLLSLFLENSPVLETLVAHDKIGFGGPELAQPKPIPTCFLTSLSRASFENFEGSKEELQIIEYILKNARVLRTMEVYTSKMSSDSKLYIIKKLSMFPRSSETCQLSFN